MKKRQCYFWGLDHMLNYVYCSRIGSDGIQRQFDWLVYVQYISGTVVLSSLFAGKACIFFGLPQFFQGFLTKTETGKLDFNKANWAIGLSTCIALNKMRGQVEQKEKENFGAQPAAKIFETRLSSWFMPCSQIWPSHQVSAAGCVPKGLFLNLLMLSRQYNNYSVQIKSASGKRWREKHYGFLKETE